MVIAGSGALYSDAGASLTRLVESPSPSGFEQPAQKLVRERMADVVDELRTDVHGNVIGVKNPGAPISVMLAGHCDEIGLMCRTIFRVATLLRHVAMLFVQCSGGLPSSLASLFKTCARAVMA